MGLTLVMITQLEWLKYILGHEPRKEELDEKETCTDLAK